MNSCELVTTISAVACAISEDSSQEYITLMAAVFTQLGDTLATIATQTEICKNKDTD